MVPLRTRATNMRTRHLIITAGLGLLVIAGAGGCVRAEAARYHRHLSTVLTPVSAEEVMIAQTRARARADTVRMASVDPRTR